jgi:predicted DNA-binding helix-hairpin-helix protein
VDTEQKLNILADSSRFDLSCACKYADEPGRQRGEEGRWIYPAALPDGRKVMLLKTLQSNACVNDCSYCPFNSRRDLQRCTLSPEQLAGTFLALRAAGRVEGLFLSSGVAGSADATMTRMLATVELLRYRHKFKGFIHLKIIPGASDAAIEQAVRLATRVSVNIEAPSAERLSRLSTRKRFHEDIIVAMRKINEYRRKWDRRGCHQTTQFVVGAAEETDREIVLATDRLYRGFEMERVYYSAYQDRTAPARASQGRLLEDDERPAPNRTAAAPVVLREHRLYQVDFLFRRYGFQRDEISFDAGGNLPLQRDPKTIWAEQHPEFFPLDVNTADKWQLLRVPGIGPISAKRIIEARRQQRIGSLAELKSLGARIHAAGSFLKLRGLYEHADEPAMAGLGW